MQAEAGHDLDTIIRRKELERQINGGMFYWGIGNALGKSMTELLRRTEQPEVLFSVMRSKPKQEDASPKSILIWTQYFNENGLLQSLPPHVLVLSRGETPSGVEKRCYALVCHSNTPLSISSLASFDVSHFRNIAGNNGKVGFSQVTTNIEHRRGGMAGTRYDINLRSSLKSPYFIRLAGARKLSSEEREAIETTMARNPAPGQWRALVESLRKSGYNAESGDELFHALDRF
jgi:hypothetical protein